MITKKLYLYFVIYFSNSNILIIPHNHRNILIIKNINNNINNKQITKILLLEKHIYIKYAKYFIIL